MKVLESYVRLHATAVVPASRTILESIIVEVLIASLNVMIIDGERSTPVALSAGETDCIAGATRSGPLPVVKENVLSSPMEFPAESLTSASTVTL